MKTQNLLASLLLAGSLLAVPMATADEPNPSVCLSAAPLYTADGDFSASIPEDTPTERIIADLECQRFNALPGEPTDEDIRVLHFEADLPGLTIQVYDNANGLLVFSAPIPVEGSTLLGIVGYPLDSEKSYVVEVMGSPDDQRTHSVWFTEEPIEP